MLMMMMMMKMMMGLLRFASIRLGIGRWTTFAKEILSLKKKDYLF